MIIVKEKLVGFGASLLLLSGMASAHHSFSAFDMSKTAQMSGTVKEWQWVNPHCFLTLEATDASGKTVTAIFETNGPGYLVRQGWKRDSLRTGDKITVSMHPMRDGSPGGNLTGVMLPNGQTLSAEVAGPKPSGTDTTEGRKNAQ